MFDRIEPFIYTIAALVCVAVVVLVLHMLWQIAMQRVAQRFHKLMAEERERSRQLCLSTVESLSYALEASDHFNVDYLDSVQQISKALAQKMHLAEDETEALHVASLLHNIGRLGVPDQILYKKEDLTDDEMEKLRYHSVLGTRILAPIPFPWDILPIVRHHTEHWDGKGYPDQLNGHRIPLSSRLLAVASAYSAMLQPRPFRDQLSQEYALNQIIEGSGTHFDPDVVAAFQIIIPTLEIRAINRATAPLTSLNDSSTGALANTRVETKNALEKIALAQRETRGLYVLAQAIAGSMNIEAVAEALIRCTMDIISCSACALFLPVQDGEYLIANEAKGLNSRHLLGSQARIGSYVTGLAYKKGEITRSKFIKADVTLRQVSDPWTDFKTQLVVPLMVNNEAVGTLNLYSKNEDDFDIDTQRIVKEIALQASRVVDSARKYGEVHERAYTDTLTGLRNVRYLREFLENEINRSGRENTPMAVLYIDLDNFKPVNDRFGHARGDQTLKEVADILKVHVRNYDLAARYAGDEFVIVLSRAGRIPAEIVATKLKLAVERHGQKLRTKEPDFPQIGISVGIVNFPEDGADLASLLCGSDAAMFADKSRRKAGRIAA